MGNRDCSVLDIEGVGDQSRGGGGSDLSCDKVGNAPSFSVFSMTINVDELGRSEKPVIVSGNLQNIGERSPDSGKNNKKDKRKSMSANKAPKPPRPPRGLSLDAADQKLIKEIAELAMIKRARIERMKKMKAAKASSVSSSSSGNVLAMLFTILFCVVIVFQGCHSTTHSPKSSSVTGISRPVESLGATTWNLDPDNMKFSPNSVPSVSVETSNTKELVSASKSINMGRKAIMGRTFVFPDNLNLATYSVPSIGVETPNLKQLASGLETIDMGRKAIN